MIETWQLAQRQGLPRPMKKKLSTKRFRQFYEHFKGEVYVAFSGGKDSTVMLEMIRKIYPDVVGVFIDTGLEYPEIRQHVKTFDNIEWIKPKLTHRAILDKYGLPIISKEVSMAINRYCNTKDPIQKEYRKYGTKHGKKIGVRGVIPKKWWFLIDAPFKISEKCCDFMKKEPAKRYHKRTGLVPYIGTMACDGQIRKMDYLNRGCNVFGSKIPQSRPLSFWLQDDIWDYIKTHNTKYCKIYDMGEKHTGCIYCMFGCHMEPTPNRFQRMYHTHPKLYNYCMTKLHLRDALEYIGVDVQPFERLDNFTD